MAAIPSNKNNFYCSKNTTAARINLNAMIDDFSQLQEADGMTQMNQLLTKTDDIYINCYLAIKNVVSLPSSIS